MKLEPNKALFKKVCYHITVNGHERYNIGTYKEKKLHLILKNYFTETAATSAEQEVSFLGHIADIMTDSEIVEIQTGNFGQMKSKLDSFLPEFPVNIVYPVADTKWLSWIDPESGDISPKHKSPKRGNPLSILPEMVYIRPFLGRENLIFTIAMLDIEEYRYLNGWSRDKKKGSRRFERIPVDICSLIRLETKDDFSELIPSPDILPDPFTMKEFMKATKMSYGDTQKSTKVLVDLGVLAKTDKRGRCDQYIRI